MHLLPLAARPADCLSNMPAAAPAFLPDVLRTGAWVPTVAGASIKVPSRDVMLLNNVIVNPKNESAQWAHFAVSVGTM
jgi:hypothetical protein